MTFCLHELDFCCGWYCDCDFCPGYGHCEHPGEEVIECAIPSGTGVKVIDEANEND